MLEEVLRKNHGNVREWNTRRKNDFVFVDITCTKGLNSEDPRREKLMAELQDLIRIGHRIVEFRSEADGQRNDVWVSLQLLPGTIVSGVMSSIIEKTEYSFTHKRVERSGPKRRYDGFSARSGARAEVMDNNINERLEAIHHKLSIKSFKEAALKRRLRRQQKRANRVERTRSSFAEDCSEVTNLVGALTLPEADEAPAKKPRLDPEFSSLQTPTEQRLETPAQGQNMVADRQVVEGLSMFSPAEESDDPAIRSDCWLSDSRLDLLGGLPFPEIDTTRCLSPTALVNGEHLSSEHRDVTITETAPEATSHLHYDLTREEEDRLLGLATGEESDLPDLSTEEIDACLVDMVLDLEQISNLVSFDALVTRCDSALVGHQSPCE